MERVLEMQGNVSAVAVAQPDNSAFCLHMRGYLFESIWYTGDKLCQALKEALGKPREWCQFELAERLERVDGDLKSFFPNASWPPALAVRVHVRARACMCLFHVVVYSHASEGAKVGDADKEVGKGGCYKPIRLP